MLSFCWPSLLATRIALKRIYEKSKPQDILKQRLNKILTPDELRGYIPSIRDFLIYLIQLVLLVGATIAYSAVDIFLYNHVFVGTNSNGEPLIPNGITLYGFFLFLGCFFFLFVTFSFCLLSNDRQPSWRVF
jgi:hypothetical protein